MEWLELLMPSGIWIWVYGIVMFYIGRASTNWKWFEGDETNGN